MIGKRSAESVITRPGVQRWQNVLSDRWRSSQKPPWGLVKKTNTAQKDDGAEKAPVFTDTGKTDSVGMRNRYKEGWAQLFKVEKTIKEALIKSERWWDAQVTNTTKRTLITAMNTCTVKWRHVLGSALVLCFNLINWQWRLWQSCLRRMSTEWQYEGHCTFNVDQSCCQRTAKRKTFFGLRIYDCDKPYRKEVNTYHEERKNVRIEEKFLQFPHRKWHQTVRIKLTFRPQTRRRDVGVVIGRIARSWNGPKVPWNIDFKVWNKAGYPKVTRYYETRHEPGAFQGIAPSL